jgi:hypothetical protein
LVSVLLGSALLFLSFLVHRVRDQIHGEYSHCIVENIEEMTSSIEAVHRMSPSVIVRGELKFVFYLRGFEGSE